MNKREERSIYSVQIDSQIELWIDASVSPLDSIFATEQIYEHLPMLHMSLPTANNARSFHGCVLWLGLWFTYFVDGRTLRVTDAWFGGGTEDCSRSQKPVCVFS